ncbi:serine hydrolase [Plantactinospora sp. B6F1]|uniref:serine hydrolase n=1 Tax=Plantactinospora sp. B6F1 TaxID=3158971 RepID=UPI0032D911DF
MSSDLGAERRGTTGDPRGAVRVPPGLPAELSELVEAERARFGVPGCAVLVVAGGRVVLNAGFGVRDLASRRPVTPDTLFPIASATKTFTAALCALLVDRGLLSWDQPVRDHLPDFRLHDQIATAQVTLADLLSHRSGLPRHDILWYAAREEAGRVDMLAALRHLDPAGGLRHAWRYNNLLYAAAGEAAARAAGRSYEAAVRELLLDPLGMHRSTFAIDDLAADEDAAQPYATAGPDGPLGPVPYTRLDLIAPAGGLNSCLTDLARWLPTLLGTRVDGHDPLLPPSALARMRTPAVPLPDRSSLAVGRPVGYGLGLIVEDYRGHRLTHHGGNIDGFASQVSTIPEAGCGVVVLTNRDGSALRDALPCLIYDRLLDLPPRPHGETALARQTALDRGRVQARERTAAPRPGLPPVRPLTDYVGDYRHPGYGKLTVTADGNGLAATYRGLAGPLTHRHLEVFNLVLHLGGECTLLPVQFQHDVHGDVSAALLAAEPAVEAVRFTRVPETAHLTDAVLDGLTGDYRLGPLEAEVRRGGDGRLTLLLVEGDVVDLTPVHGLVFAIGGGGARVEFTEDGRLLTPIGDLARR